MTQLENVIERAISDDAPISLDSSVLIAYLAGEQPQNGLIEQLLESEAQIVISAITASESFVRTLET